MNFSEEELKNEELMVDARAHAIKWGMFHIQCIDDTHNKQIELINGFIVKSQFSNEGKSIK